MSAVSKTIGASLNLGLKAAMEADNRVLLLGEDLLDPYGGAFKVARGLSTAFPERVITTPISEAGIVSVAVGLALRGFRPVAEIMFGDFIFLAADQIVNHAAKYRWMFNDKVRVPIVIRTPMGGRRGYGPTHSQSLEKHFIGVPGLSVVAPNALYEPGSLLKKIVLSAEDPTLFIENKVGYSQPVLERLDGYHVRHIMDAHSSYATTWVRPEGSLDGVLWCYGGMVEIALEALNLLREREGLYFGLAVPAQLSPTPSSHIMQIVEEAQANVFVSVEEGNPTGGWGSEIVAAIETVREKLAKSPFTYRRIGAADTPVPSSRNLERAALPQRDDILDKVLDCF